MPTEDAIPAQLEPIGPGLILSEDFLIPMGISPEQLSMEIGVSVDHITSVIAGSHEITADIDARLCSYFGLTHGYWLRAQVASDH